MKKITLLVIMIVTAFTLNAQSLVKYHGEINAGYSVGIGTFATNRVNVHTIQGVDISKYFSIGVGIGLDYYHELYEKGKGELVLPLFLNMKGYLPATETVSPFFSLDLGVGIGLTKGVDGMAGFICTPSVGVKLSHCTLQVGYNMQRNSEYGFGYTMGSIQMKLGYIF